MIGVLTSAITYPLSIRIVKKLFGVRDFLNVHMVHIANTKAALPIILNANAFVLGISQGFINHSYLAFRYPQEKLMESIVWMKNRDNVSFKFAESNHSVEAHYHLILGNRLVAFPEWAPLTWQFFILKFLRRLGSLCSWSFSFTLAADESNLPLIIFTTLIRDFN